MSDKNLFEREPDLGFEVVNQALDRLDAANWISRNDEFHWVLVRDLHRETIVELMQIAPTIVQAGEVPNIKLDGADERFVRALKNHAAWLNKNMDIPIADLIVEHEASLESSPPGDDSPH